MSSTRSSSSSGTTPLVNAPADPVDHFRYMEASAIMARTMQGRQKLVTDPTAASRKNLAGAKTLIADMRVDVATKIRKGTKDIEREIVDQAAERQAHAAEYVSPLRAAIKKTHPMPNAWVHKSLRQAS